MPGKRLKKAAGAVIPAGNVSKTGVRMPAFDRLNYFDVTFVKI